MNIEPQQVFNFFEEISQIPRGSGNVRGISDYLVGFAKERDLEVYQDDMYNIIIKKNGSKGYENSPAVIIQGHMDMVCEKEINVGHNFLCDPINIYVDGDFITAQGTTLGSDNGVGVAIALALLNSNDISHPPLEIILTSDEEIGMNGALFLDCSNITGRLFINIDSEEENKILTSCAGGVSAEINLNIDWQDADYGLIPYIIRISGLKGGHSGIDINKRRANANKLMGRLLTLLLKKYNLSLAKINCYGKENAIARESEVVILISHDVVTNVKNDLKNMQDIFKNEYRGSDTDILISFTRYTKVINEVFSDDTSSKVSAMLNIIPNGIQTMSPDINGFVESSINLGIVSTTDSHINFTCGVRSSVNSQKRYIKEQLVYIALLIGASISFRGNYPPWEYKADSKLRRLFKNTYKELFNTDMIETSVHAGLECGVFSEKINNVDIVAIGPNAFNIHTTDEKLSVSSTARIWKLLIAVLASLR